MQAIAVIEKALQTMPPLPGVYKMIGKKGILYIGKAKNLKNRVKSYTNILDATPKNLVMIQNIINIEYEVVNTEEDALVLEASLIKKHKPQFNILLKDDKTNPYIVVSKSLSFPAIFKVRRDLNKKDEFFGPFSDKKAIDDVIDLVCKTFKLRSCLDTKFKSAKRPCLEYQIKRCSAPCVGFISKEDYAKDVKMAIDLLSGGTSKIIKDMRSQMTDFSVNEEFEKAIIVRDKLFRIQKLLERTAIDFTLFIDTDAILINEVGGQVGIGVFGVRSGFSSGSSIFFPTRTEGEMLSTILELFLVSFYCEKSIIPKHVVLNIEIESKKLIEKVLSKLAGFDVKISTKAQGKYRKLIEFAIPNLEEKLAKKFNETSKVKENLAKLKEVFDLESIPKRIEIYDNSHTNGAFLLGAMVVFQENGFKKDEYRKFNAKFEETKDGDDYGMLREVLRRRFLNPKISNIKPDLIIIDGGRGQYSSAESVFNELGITVPFLCMAKGKDRNAGREWIFYRNKSFQLPPRSDLLYYLQVLRDEAHRFAITSHRNRRDKVS